MTADEKSAYAHTFPVHVGVDTGKSFHKLVARGAGGHRTKALTVPVSRAGFDTADAHLVSLFPDIHRARMLVGIEFAGHHGFTFAHDLRRRGYVIVNVLPSVTKRFKEVEDNSPRKDDAKDAAQICKLLEAGLFVGFPELDELPAELRLLTTERQRVTVDETRLRNRLLSVLDLAWPEFAGFFCTIAKPTALALLGRWPLPCDLAGATPQTVYRVATTVSQNHFPRERVARLLETARTSVALCTAAPARRAEIHRLLARWDLLRRQLQEIDTRLALLVEQHPAARALTTVPGVSVVCAATLVAELGTPETYESPRQVLKLAGMNLAGKESGTSVRGRIRQTKRGRPALRRQIFLLAARWCMTRGLYRGEYLALRARNGGAKTSAMCAIARKLVPLLLHIMQTGEAFDEMRWRAVHDRAPSRAA